MSELSSSLLLGNSNPISENVYNTIRNCIDNGGVQLHPLSLLPVLTDDKIRHAYYIINNQPEMTLYFIGQQSECCFFFYKTNGLLYYIVTNHDSSEIYSTEQTHFYE